MGDVIESVNAEVFLKNVDKHNIKNDTDFLISELKLTDHDYILDVGYGRGDLLKKLRGKNETLMLYGIEKSKVLFDHSWEVFEKRGINNYHEDFNEQCFDTKFNLIIISYYLHHVDDYRKHIEKSLELLKVGGTIYIVDRIACSDDAKLEFKEYWEKHYYAQHEWHEECPRILTLEDIENVVQANNAVVDNIKLVPNDSRVGVGNFPKTLIRIVKRGSR